MKIILNAKTKHNSDGLYSNDTIELVQGPSAQIGFILTDESEILIDAQELLKAVSILAPYE